MVCIYISGLTPSHTDSFIRFLCTNKKIRLKKNYQTSVSCLVQPNVLLLETINKPQI